MSKARPDAAAKGKKRATETDASERKQPSQPRPVSLHVDISDSDFSDSLIQGPSVGSSVSSIQYPSAEGGSTVSTLQSLPTPVAYDMAAISADELFPSRYLKQPHSGHKKVAYVVFNGLSPGLYYNWNTCDSSMAGMPDSAKRYMGFKSYEEAHAAWDNYVLDGTLPRTLPAITSEIAALARNLRDDMLNLRAAQEAAVERLPPPSSLLSGPSTSRRPSPIPPASSTSPRVHEHSATLRSNPGPTASSGTGSARQEHAESTPPDFFVVYGGFAPGVFPNRASAEAAGNDLSNKFYFIVPTYSAATELFTEYFMLGRVRYLPGRSD